MALYIGSNNITAERTGIIVDVPNNDIARLMYYLNCVCTSINCNDDPDIQRFTNYNNWASLSIDDQKILVTLCYTFSPDVFNNQVFFQSDELCGNRGNEFYTINQISNHLIAAESIVVGGQVRVVNQIMVYKMQWIKSNYFDPMQRLVRRLNAPPPSVTYTSPVNRQRDTPPVIREPIKKKKKCSRCCKCCSIFIIILLLIGAGVGIFFILKQQGIIK